MGETRNADGSTTYKHVTAKDYAREAIPGELDGLAQQIARQADTHGVVSEEAMLKLFEGNGILPDGTRNHNSLSTQHMQEFCRVPEDISDFMGHVKDAAKLAAYEYHVEVTVPDVPNMCRRVGVKTPS